MTERQLHGEYRLPSLEGLTDEQYLRASREFGDRYVSLVNGESATGDPLFDVFEQGVSPYLRPLEGLEDPQVVDVMVTGYRTGLKADHKRRNPILSLLFPSTVPFRTTELTDSDRALVHHVERRIIGLPVLYTEGAAANEILFNESLPTFHASREMSPQGLPSLMVVYAHDPKREEKTRHELSHAVHAILSEHGVVPAPAAPRGGSRSDKIENQVFERARDEAVAQIVGDQTDRVHETVIAEMRRHRFNESEISTYRQAWHDAFNTIGFGESSISPTDIILGVISARNFGELQSHLRRMGDIRRDWALRNHG